MSERKVTVFVTVYNIEKHLKRFFECLQAQSYTDFEALLIDDGSSDNSLAVCQEYAEHDDRIRVIPVKHIGISAARNLAFSEIRTPYAASVDGDDYFEKDYLKHLMDAAEKYHADMVLSNVIYVYENGEEKERFPFRGESFYTRDEFDTLLPALLDESRLNFLYAKLYKTELLKEVRVEENVMQGSDTMINCMALKKVNSIAVIENYDYHYVQYQKRSVTSYKGADFFKRLYRINRFVTERMEEYGWLNDEMQRIIDGRILHSGTAYLARIGASADSMRNKYAIATETINSEEYLCSYRRQEQRGNLDSFRFRVIAPGTEKEYIDFVCRLEQDKKKTDRVKKLRSKCPQAVFQIWHKLRMITGTARKS